MADPVSRLGGGNEDSRLERGRRHWAYPSDPSLFDVGMHRSEGSTLEMAKIKEIEEVAEKTCDWSQEYPRCPQFGKL